MRPNQCVGRHDFGDEPVSALSNSIPSNSILPVSKSNRISELLHTGFFGFDFRLFWVTNCIIVWVIALVLDTKWWWVILLKIIHSPNKHGRRVNNTNTIKTTQLQSRRKHLKLDSHLDTRLTHNTLGKAKPKYSWQYFTISIFLVVKSFFYFRLSKVKHSNCGCM